MKNKLSYIDRLSFLKLDPLELRRIRIDLIWCYKILNKLVDIPKSDLFIISPKVTARGHSKKLYVKPSKSNIIQQSFSFRVPKVWNSLPELIHNQPLICAENLNLFKNRLKSVNLDNYLHFNRNL